MKPTKDYVNLMPKAGPEPRRLPGPWAAMVMIFIMGWTAAFSWQWMQQRDLRKRLTFAAKEKQDRARELDSLYQELGIAGPGEMSTEKAALVISLMNERVEWSEVFRRFSMIAPAGLWFDSVEGTANERAEIKIRGGALSYMTVSKFMRSMQDTGYFLSPRLVFAQKIEIRGRDAIGFEIVSAVRKGKGMK